MKAKTESDIVFTLFLVVLFFSLCMTLAQARMRQPVSPGNAMVLLVKAISPSHP